MKGMPAFLVRFGAARRVAALLLALAAVAWPYALDQATPEGAVKVRHGGRGLGIPAVDGGGRGGPGRPATAPRRVVCLTPSAAEIVCALGRADTLVGAVLYSDYPEEAARLPRVGSYANPDLERVAALEPDLCLGVAGMTPESCVARLGALGIGVALFTTDTLEDVLASILLAGELLGAEPQARDLAAGMRARLDAVARAVADAPDRPGVLYQIGQAPMHAAGGGTYLDEAIRLAGGRNVCAALTGYPRLSMEQAVALSPQVIFIPTMGRDAFARAAGRWAHWPEVAAVASGRIHLLDSDLFDRPGPRLVQGIEQMARLLHPGISLAEVGP